MLSLSFQKKKTQTKQNLNDYQIWKKRCFFIFRFVIPKKTTNILLKKSDLSQHGYQIWKNRFVIRKKNNKHSFKKDLTYHDTITKFGKTDDFFIFKFVIPKKTPNISFKKIWPITTRLPNLEPSFFFKKRVVQKNLQNKDEQRFSMVRKNVRSVLSENSITRNISEEELTQQIRTNFDVYTQYCPS